MPISIIFTVHGNALEREAEFETILGLMTKLITAIDDYASAGKAFVELVAALPENSWELPGLGKWDVRSLVGHTSNALTSPPIFLDAPTDVEEITKPEEYYVALLPYMIDPTGEVTERGRQVGQRLGDNPAAVVADMLAAVLTRLAAVEGDPLIKTRAGGMRLSTYLPNRTLELVVHSTDISKATGIAFTPPAEALAASAALAARAACAFDKGAELLRALTGRDPYPAGFSIVG